MRIWKNTLLIFDITYLMLNAKLINFWKRKIVEITVKGMSNQQKHIYDL